MSFYFKLYLLFLSYIFIMLWFGLKWATFTRTRHMVIMIFWVLKIILCALWSISLYCIRRYLCNKMPLFTHKFYRFMFIWYFDKKDKYNMSWKINDIWPKYMRKSIFLLVIMCVSNIIIVITIIIRYYVKGYYVRSNISFLLTHMKDIYTNDQVYD